MLIYLGIVLHLLQPADIWDHIEQQGRERKETKGQCRIKLWMVISYAYRGSYRFMPSPQTLHYDGTQPSNPADIEHGPKPASRL
jgi:hypothetical protein